MRMSEFITGNAKPIRRNGCKRTTTRAADGFFFFAPFAKASDVCLLSTFQSIPTPYDIILSIILSFFDELTDLTFPFLTIGNELYIVDTLIAFVVQIDVRHHLL